MINVTELFKNISAFFITLSSPRGARAFHELRRYHTMPLRLNWGPKNVHFGKRHFRDPNINAGATISYFVFSTTVPKNGLKNSQKFKKRRKMTKTISPLFGDPL